MATSGIGLFNERHVAIDKDCKVHAWPVDPAVKDDKNNVVSTHLAAWQLLRAWANEPGNGTRLLDAIRVSGQSLAEWLDTVVRERARSGMVSPDVSDTVRAVLAKEWLDAWSIDLKEPDHDRSIRNLVSYNPTRILGPQPEALDPESGLIDPLTAHWTALEPAGPRGEAAIDAALLIGALRRLSDRVAVPFSDFTDALVSLAGEPFKDRILRSEEGFEEFFSLARESADESTPVPVLSRATLLLRLACALTSDVLNRASVSREDIAFWWIPFGQDVGFWVDSPEDTMFTALWAPVSESLEEIDVQVAALPAISFESASWVVSGHVPATQFSRASLWLLGVDR